MKTKFVLLTSFIICVALVFLTESTQSKQNPCLKVIKEVSNPDSVAVDTCPESKYYRDWFALKNFILLSDSNIFNIPLFPKDTSLKNYNWRAFPDRDSLFKTCLQGLENEFSTFNIYFHNDYPDSTKKYYRYNIIFDDYVPLNHVLFTLLGFKPNYIYDVGFYQYPDYTVPGFKDEITDNSFKIRISNNIITIDFSKTGLLQQDCIQIFNTLGECVMSLETGLRPVSTKIDISGLPAGVYFVRWGGQVGRFVKW